MLHQCRNLRSPFSVFVWLSIKMTAIAHRPRHGAWHTRTANTLVLAHTQTRTHVALIPNKICAISVTNTFWSISFEICLGRTKSVASFVHLPCWFIALTEGPPNARPASGCSLISLIFMRQMSQWTKPINTFLLSLTRDNGGLVHREISIWICPGDWEGDWLVWPSKGMQMQDLNILWSPVKLSFFCPA